MSDNTGGPAFPCDLTMYDKEVQSQMQGMTLRDYFAAKMMQSDILVGSLPEDFKDYALRAYQMADEMLKAREQ